MVGQARMGDIGATCRRHMTFQAIIVLFLPVQLRCIAWLLLMAIDARFQIEPIRFLGSGRHVRIVARAAQ